MNRREWIVKSGLAAGGILLAPTWISCIREKAGSNNPHIMLVSGWQTVNIGDIAHTPGLIHLLKTYFPDIKITLWPNDIDLHEEKSLMSYFPGLEIVRDDFARTGVAGSEEAFKAIEDADFMLHPYWQPDDAAALYARAAVVVSAECHSPIIALVNGTPAIYVRQPSDTIKGHMYYDLKLDDWIFEIEQTTGKQIADRVMEIVGDFDQSLEKVRLLNERVRAIYEGNMEELRRYLFK